MSSTASEMLYEMQQTLDIHTRDGLEPAETLGRLCLSARRWKPYGFPEEAQAERVRRLLQPWNATMPPSQQETMLTAVRGELHA
jgi:hypothetical protein